MFGGFIKKSRQRRVYHPQLVAVYHQRLAVVYHPAAGKYTLARDDIQGRRAALDDIRHASRGNDIPSLRLG